jgi:hypothetical protein
MQAVLGLNRFNGIVAYILGVKKFCSFNKKSRPILAAVLEKALAMKKHYCSLLGTP